MDLYKSQKHGLFGDERGQKSNTLVLKEFSKKYRQKDMQTARKKGYFADKTDERHRNSDINDFSTNK